jgi:hypothetical protein
MPLQGANKDGNTITIFKDFLGHVVGYEVSQERGPKVISVNNKHQSWEHIDSDGSHCRTTMTGNTQICPCGAIEWIVNHGK